MNSKRNTLSKDLRNQIKDKNLSLVSLDGFLRNHGNPKFGELGMTNDVISILKEDLIVGKRRTNEFREILIEKLFQVDQVFRSSVDWSTYRNLFTSMLDKVTFDLIFNEIILSKDIIQKGKGGKLIINKEVSIHELGNRYYLMSAVQEARIGVDNKSQKESIKSLKRDTLRVFAGCFEKAQQIFSPDFHNINIDPNHLMESRDVGKHRPSFKLSCVNGNYQRTIANPTYDRKDGPPSWVNGKTLLPGKEFHPKELHRYVDLYKQHLYDFLFE